MNDPVDPRWQRIKDLFEHAKTLAPGPRSAWLTAQCREDAALQQEVGALVQAHFDAGQFMQQSVLEIPGAAAAVAHATMPHEAPLDGAERFGDYRIVREIGRGGMAVVYLAARDDDRFEKLVAIKIIAGGRLDPVASARFLEERRILASLDHPGIARLLDAGSSASGVPYVVMEYVEGEPIDAFCRTRRLSVRERLALFTRVCEAVQYSHERLVVHRDIKARNILVTPEGAPKLLDFGIAKLLAPGAASPDATRVGFRALTPESASPEQVRGEPVTVATDVYSLGVLLYRLLTGVSPYRDDLTSDSAIVRAICEDEPRRPSAAASGTDRRELQGDIDFVILRALRKEPARRYSSVEQFAQDIHRYLRRLPVLAAPDSWAYRARKFADRHWVGIGAAALLALSLTGGIVATTWQAHRAREAQARADRRFNDVRRLASSVLFELHDAIEPLPGSTKARQLVVQRATEYLDSLSKESANDPTLERELAASYERVGDVQGLPTAANLGDTDGALKSHQRAVTIREALAARSPSDTALQRELAITHVHLGDLFRVKGNMPIALTHVRRSLSIRQALYDRAPTDEQARRSLAVGLFYLGDLATKMEDWAAARDAKERETALFETILATNPSDPRAQRDLAIAYKTLGSLLERDGDRPAALARYRQALALDARRLEANPTASDAKLDLSFSQAAIGYALSDAGDLAGSLEQYGRALKLRQEVATADVHDVRAQDLVSRAHVSLGQVLRKYDRRVEAIAQFRQALEITLRLSTNSTDLARAEPLARIYGALAITEVELAGPVPGRSAAAPHCQNARRWAAKGLAMWEALAGQRPLTRAAQADVDQLRLLMTACSADAR